MIFETKKTRLRNLVLHLESEISTISRAKKMADLWSAFFFPDRKIWKVNGDSIKVFHDSYLLAWESCWVRPIYISKASPIERSRHNFKVGNFTAAHFTSGNVLFVPDIPDTMDAGTYINAPKKYIIFLQNIQHPFKRVVFYCDAASTAYYQLDKDILYINTHFDDECPMSVIHEVIGRNIILPKTKLQELRRYQQDGVAPIDGYAQNLEERFVRDYVAHMLGHNPSVFVSASLRTPL